MRSRNKHWYSNDDNDIWSSILQWRWESAVVGIIFLIFLQLTRYVVISLSLSLSLSLFLLSLSLSLIILFNHKFLGKKEAKAILGVGYGSTGDRSYRLSLCLFCSRRRSWNPNCKWIIIIIIILLIFLLSCFCFC